MFIYEQFQQSTEAALVFIGRLDAVFQVGKTGLAGPGMSVIEIRSVVQCPALKHDGIAFFADDGGGKE